MVASINEQVKADSADPAGLTKRLPAAEKQSRLGSPVEEVDRAENSRGTCPQSPVVGRCKRNGGVWNHNLDCAFEVRKARR